MMAGFDLHGFCARCHDKKKGKDPCVMSADLSVSWHYVVTLRRGRTRPREQLLLQNYKA